ncbi:SRA stem-loop-interacting RNA-binding protein, mitochondrial-like [Ptiloglossa arizonensis]|uniref:SRA stem-loop-interacting RNA-binding protein, mitochondrial-like n=1 Tax=Ptiloglossa arizonensis TaxID=3350558 RepID=UPI003F9F2595
MVRYLINVRNIPWTVSHSDFKKYFLQFGSVLRARIIFDENGFAAGQGTVEFSDELTLNNVLHSKHTLQGQTLIIAKVNFKIYKQ